MATCILVKCIANKVTRQEGQSFGYFSVMFRFNYFILFNNGQNQELN